MFIKSHDHHQTVIAMFMLSFSQWIIRRKKPARTNLVGLKKHENTI